MKKILVVITVLVLAVAAFGSSESRNLIKYKFESMPETTEQEKTGYLAGVFNPLDYARDRVSKGKGMFDDRRSKYYQSRTNYRLWVYLEQNLSDITAAQSRAQVAHGLKYRILVFSWKETTMPYQILTLIGLGVMWLVYGIWMKFGAAIKKYSVAAGRATAKGWAWATTPRRLMIAGVLLLAVIATALLV